MKRSNFFINFVKVVFGVALSLAVLGSVYIILISINPYWELTSENATLNIVLYTLSGLREMFFIVILPMTIVMILTFLALMLISKKDDSDGDIEFVEIKGKKEIDPQPIFDRIEELKQKKRVTPRMIMPLAVKLEKLKNSHKYKDDEQFQVKARTSLNWCYEKIGKVEYDVKPSIEELKTVD